MSSVESRSEVARLMQQITEEYEAAQRGLTGLASGTAHHDIINAHLHNMNQHHEALKLLVGKQEAIKMLFATVEKTEVEE